MNKSRLAFVLDIAFRYLIIFFVDEKDDKVSKCYVQDKSQTRFIHNTIFAN